MADFINVYKCVLIVCSFRVSQKGAQHTTIANKPKQIISVYEMANFIIVYNTFLNCLQFSCSLKTKPQTLTIANKLKLIISVYEMAHFTDVYKRVLIVCRLRVPQKKIQYTKMTNRLKQVISIYELAHFICGYKRF